MATKKPKKPKKWQDDEEFCRFLEAMEYDNDVLSEGLYIYMWEAWRASRGDISMIPKKNLRLFFG